MLPVSLPGTDTVTLTWTNDTKIDVFEGSDKSTPVSSFAEYELRELPKTLYVEGDVVSESVRDVELTLFYILDEQPRSEDRVRVTVVQIDLSAQDLDGTVSEADEEDPIPHDKDKGAFVHCNVDNDNYSDNDIGAPKQPGADYYEHYNDPVTGEDDLKSAVITLQPASLQTGKVVLERKNSILWVWTDPEKGPDEKLLIESDTKTWDLADSEQRTDFNNVKDDLWVEGFDDTYSTLTVRFLDPNDQIVYQDSVDYKFICAKCGDQPLTEAVEDVTDPFFPANPPFDYYQRQKLGEIGSLKYHHCEWSITDNSIISTKELIRDYNCIAWSVDEINVWYNAWDIDEDFGDNDGWFEDSDMDAFYDDRKTWSLITTGTDEEKAENAETMYYPYSSAWHWDQPDPPDPGDGYHAARKKSCSCGAGRWDNLMFESKCGPYERIEHVWNQLNGSPYGSPGRFYE